MSDILYIAPLTDIAAASALCTDTLQRGNLTAASLTVMVKILQSELPASYGAAMSASGKISNEFKDAVRKTEEIILKPLYEAGQRKGTKQLDLDAGFITFMRTLRNGGVYSKVKSEACSLYAITGTLPCVVNTDGTYDTSKMLSSALMGERVRQFKKIKDAVAGPKGDKWLNKIVDLATSFISTDDSIDLDKEAIAAAKRACVAMMAKLDGLTTVRVIAPGKAIAPTVDVVALVKTTIDNASAKPTPKPLTGKALDKASAKLMPQDAVV